MKTVLCFGDSNTYGYIPGSPGERYDSKTRWPKRLGALLGEGYEVVVEGLNGRTTAFGDNIHFTPEDHRLLAQALEPLVRELIG